ncbi:MAG: hypothetical protein KDB87_18025 [Flavobacteriales bacterium]|nr:hypothetical protein [Flavobacteriales bacterium]MCB0818741.1 hypothetical protein [Flavobacteriales bacterium]
MEVKLRYPAAILLIISFCSFAVWAYSHMALVSIGLDLKYLESEVEVHLARKAEWTRIASQAGWTLITSTIVLSLLLTYRWFFVPSRG